MSKKDKNRQDSVPAPKPRNRVALNPLMKKSHAHTKSPKADRVKAKQEIKRGLEES